MLLRLRTPLLTALILLLVAGMSHAQGTYRDWIRSESTHPSFELIDRDLAKGLISAKKAAEQKLRLIVAPETAEAKYVTDISDVIVKCLTPVLLDAESFGINTQSIFDSQNVIQSIQADTQKLVSPMGLFQVTYFLEGTHAISTEDLNQNGIPDYAELTALAADSSYRHMVQTLGFLDPFPAKNKPLKINIRLLASGTYGYVNPFTSPNAAIFIQSDYNKPQFIKNDDENKVIGAMKVTVAHELKHILQSVTIAPGMNPYGWIEMDATLMEEIVYDNVNDYYNYLNSSQSVFRSPDRSVVSGNYYHSSWALYFAERFGMSFWTDVWTTFTNQMPAPNQLLAMGQVANERESMMSQEVTRNYLWHLAAGDNTVDGYGFSEAEFYPNIKLDQTISDPNTEVEIIVGTIPNYAARLFMLDFSNESGFSDNEELSVYLKNNSGNQQFNLGLLAFYKDGTVQEYIPTRTNEFELIITPDFDYSELDRLGIAIVNTGGVATSGTIALTKQLSVNLDKEIVDLPVQTTLLPNYPNPFNPTTNISFLLKESGQTRLEVFDILGRSVALLANTSLRAGPHTFSFDASGLSTGTYLVRLTASDGVFNSKVMLVK